MSKQPLVSLRVLPRPSQRGGPQTPGPQHRALIGWVFVVIFVVCFIICERIYLTEMLNYLELLSFFIMYGWGGLSCTENEIHVFVSIGFIIPAFDTCPNQI